MKTKYILTFAVSIAFYFIFVDIGFYLAHNAGAALIALLLSPGLVVLFIPIPELLSSILSIILNMLYYLFLYTIYNKIRIIKNVGP